MFLLNVSNVFWESLAMDDIMVADWIAHFVYFLSLCSLIFLNVWAVLLF